MRCCETDIVCSMCSCKLLVLLTALLQLLECVVWHSQHCHVLLLANVHAATGTSRQQDGEDAAVQRASNLFLQQVEDSRRRYAFEVEELKVRLVTAD